MFRARVVAAIHESLSGTRFPASRGAMRSAAHAAATGRSTGMGSSESARMRVSAPCYVWQASGVVERAEETKAKARYAEPTR